LIILSMTACSQTPQTAEEILARSVASHGGEALSQWTTLAIKGTVVMNDGVDFDAGYLLFAEKPGKLRVERDLTADKGRLFYEYFMNNGVAWNRFNLIPREGDLSQMERMLNQCDGVAYYAAHADELILKADDVVEAAPAYVVEAVIGEDSTDLYFDKETFHLVQERYDGTTRIFSDFRRFGDVVLAGRTLEIAETERGERRFPITYETVEYDVPIEGWLFEEDMPKGMD
jgi:hypothetical protein